MAKNLFLTINERVMNQLKEADNVTIKAENIPYEYIEIVTPNYLTTFEDMLKARPEVKNDPKELAWLKFFMTLPYKITVKKIDANTLDVLVTIVSAKKTQKVIECTVNTANEIVLNVIDGGHSIESEGEDVVMLTLQFVGKLLTYLNKPTTIKEVTSTKQAKTKNNKKKKTGKKKAPVQYVYKTVYKVSDITVEKSTRARRQSAERQWNKEEWQRRGHYRVYRDKNTGEIKKRVWIDTTVCRAHGKIKENQNFKITRID